MEKSEPTLSNQIEWKTVAAKCAEFVGFRLLSSVGGIGSFVVNMALPVSNSLTLILLGTGII
jgi:hypothetical protein